MLIYSMKHLFGLILIKINAKLEYKNIDAHLLNYK